jgi:hypothetical protein
MTKSDLQETVLTLFLRLNGYFATGFIVHAEWRNQTEIDALAVRFPHQQEPERVVGTSPVLDVPTSCIDFLVCEVKGGTGQINFNAKFRESQPAIRSVLHRFGAFHDEEVESLIPKIVSCLEPSRVQRSTSFPKIVCPAENAQIRFLPVAPDQVRPSADSHPYVYGDDMFNFIWECFRPATHRASCDVRYNWELWGEQYTKLVRYFKDLQRTRVGTIADLYHHFCVA